MRIRQLPAIVANQIAAGEVIERPASVVKELLENALDAKADSINIEIGYGGLNQIKISDNGAGILADDLPLAIAANATSKISQLKDLCSITSMGFRGEALASIAAISRVSISSKPEEQDYAMMLTSDGNAVRVAPCARSQGTTIDVRDIFYNAPVRKKFLKTERSEFQAIETVVKRIALSAPSIAIHLTHNGKPQLNLGAAHCDKTRLLRVRKLFGKAFVEQAIYFDVQHAGLRLQGWTSNKDYQRSQNDQQWIYVNARIVKDKLLSHAIKQAYESFLYPGRHPACLLYLTIDPEEVDVNVHPTKHEVRFQQPRLVHDFISSQIQQALQIPQIAVNYSVQVPEKKTALQVCENFLPPSIFSENSIAKPEETWINLTTDFALVFREKEPYLIDVIKLQQHWLLSLLRKERLPLSSRPLLVPVSYPFNQSNWEIVKAYSEALNQIGMQVDLAGEHALLVRSLPILVPHLAIKQFLTAVFNAPLSTTEQLLNLLVSHQCFTTQQVSAEEAKELISYLQSFSDCPDGLNYCCKRLSTTVCRELLNA